MKKLSSFFIALLLTLNLFSQIKFQRTYDIGFMDLFTNVQQTTDGGFIVTGTNMGFPPIYSSVIKLDTAGTVEWAKDYGDGEFLSFFGTYFLNDVKVTSDGGYILTGECTSSGYDDLFLIKTDANGNVQWSKGYGGGNSDIGNYVMQTSDGGYLSVGTTYSFGIKDSANIYMVKTDASGNMQWDRAVQIVPNDDDVAMAVEEAADGFIVVGRSEQVFAGVDTTSDIVILKTDINGVVQWLNTYGNDTEDETANAIELINSGSIIVSGYTTESISGLDASDGYILDINGLGNITWSSAYDIGFSDEPQSIKKTSDGGYTIIGFTISQFFPLEFKSFLMKANSSGNIDFAMHYGTGTNFAIFSDGQQTSDNGYILGTIGVLGYDYYMIKTDEFGNSGCNESPFTAVKRTFSPPPIATAHTDFSGGGSQNINVDVNTVTPAETTLCLEVPCDTPIVSITPANPSICAGESATLTASGASTYSWDTGDNTAATTVSPTTTTTYTVIGTTGGICPSNPTSITVNVTAAPTVSISGTTSICTGESTTLTASGGDTYSWTSGDNTAFTTISPTGNTTYTVTVTNSGTGCTNTASQLVTVNPLPTIIISGTTSICAGESTTLTASGGDTYTWDTGDNTAATTISPVSNTTYTVTATNSVTGCTSTSSQLVTVNSLPVASISGTTSICEGESTTLTASGGDVYAWDTGDNIAATTISPVSNTTYTVTVTNSVTGCTSTSSQLVTVNPLPIITIGGLAAVCDGASATLIASGGDTYLWSTGDIVDSIIVNPASDSTYYVTVTNSGTGCSATSSQLVTVNSAPVASIGGITTICEGESTILTASGADVYVWDTGDSIATTTVTPSSNTTYNVTVTNSSTGCFATSSQLITVNPVPIILFSGDTSLCFGDTTTISISGGDLYLWNNGDSVNYIIINPSNNIDYYITVTDSATACYSIDTINVYVHPLPVVQALGTNTTCQGVNAQITASGGTSYSWNPVTGLSDALIANPIATPDSTTIYTVTVFNDFGCYDTASVTITINPAPQFTLSGTSITCNNQADGNANVSIISGVSPVTYIWNNGDTSSIITNLNVGYYNITVTDAINCSAYDSILITEPLVLTDSINITNISCNGLTNGQIELIMLGGTLPYTYLWNDSTISFVNSNLPQGTYSVTITDDNGCTLVISKIDITEPSNIQDSIISQNVYCYGGNDAYAQVLVSGGIPPYTYNWSNSQTASTNISLSSGLYSVTITDANGCSTTAQTIISEPLEIVYTDEIIPASCIGNYDGEISITVYGGTQPYTYLWSNQQTDSFIAGLYADVYTVTVTDNNNCEFSETFEVTELQGSCLEIPTLFTPNDDGKNDYWEIEGINLYPYVEVEIYNRWGDIVYKSKGYTEPWDGTFNGKKLPISSYVFILTLDENTEPVQGIVTIKY